MMIMARRRRIRGWRVIGIAWAHSVRSMSMWGSYISGFGASWWGRTSNNNTHSSTMRSMFLVSRNLPENTGASQGNQGQMTALLPIINMQAALEKALLATSTGNLQEIKNNLDIIPSREKDFKRLFDEYSEGVSYKQQYLDKNAFLV